MKKCKCSIYAGHPGGGRIPVISGYQLMAYKITWPKECIECGKEIPTKEDAGVVLDSYAHGIVGLCKVCREISSCFFCTVGLGELWDQLRHRYKEIGLGNLKMILSEEAANLMIEKVDQWMEEDEREEVES